MRVPARERRRWRALAFATVPAALLVTTTVEASPPTDPPPALSEVPGAATPVDIVTGTKAPSSRLAQTDPELLGRTDATTVSVLVKLDYDSVATYGGGIDGLAPTSPSVTGRALTESSSAEVSYDAFIEDEEAAFAADLQEAVPAAAIGTSLRTVYGGVAVQLPANEIDALLAIPNVVAVQQDKLLQPLTDSSRDFIGATALYERLGGDRNAGKGVIFGVLDSGVWPEHASFADQGNLARPPRTYNRQPRTCDFGDNPLTTAVDVFVCNKKLISGQAFLETYNEVVGDEVYTTARDSDGHGTHTGSTAAGNHLDSAEVFGVEQGPIGGIAPGAWVAAYKVCGAAGCYSSDSAAAVAQAILDGVKVINFSISGGTDPATDAVELAFLDAYAAGVFVATSAGNDGPAAGSANHLSPWVTTVAASTQQREFVSTLTLIGADGSTLELTGASITAGVEEPTPVVFPATDRLCQAPAAPTTYAGVIVACERGVNARVDKGFNVLAGGAVGMILYNPTLADIETDNHWLPTVHLADGTDLLAYAEEAGPLSATFTAGTKQPGQPDVMAAFSSRGPAGAFIKPDITAPGVQILAGHTPTPDTTTGGPPGEYFQAIAGTSMSSPHIAGSAILLKALHPGWTPGQIKSALMTTALQDVVKEDLVTPTDPFDDGAGRVDLTVAGNPGVTFDESASDMFELGLDPRTAVHVNLPSVNAPVLPGRIETTRTVANVSGKRARYSLEATAPDGSSITLSPKKLNIAADQTASFDITIESSLTDGSQQFGEIRLVSMTAGVPDLHLPVAFVPQQGEVTLASTCEPDEIARGQQTTCEVTAQNTGFNEISVDLSTSVDRALKIVGAEGASVTRGLAVVTDAVLSPALVGTPSVEPGSLAGYVPLTGFGGTLVTPIGDEEIVNFDVPAFAYAGRTYSSLGVSANGYLVVGDATGEDNSYEPVIPSPSRPNNVLAPYWTDLDGTGRPGILVNVLTDGVDDWIVVEWRVNVFGSNSQRTFQAWLGTGGETEDITFAYPRGGDLAAPAGQDLLVGAENSNGSGGDSLGLNVVPTTDLRITSSEPEAGGAVSYDVFVRGERVGEGTVTTEMDSPDLLGTTIVRSTVTVTRR